MITRMRAAGTVLLAVLAGCASGDKSTSLARGVASPPAAGCHAAKKKCFVDAIEAATACKFAFDPDVLKVKPSNRGFVIVWRLPDGYVFRPALGDGVTFTKEPPGDEFENGYSTDSDDGDPPAAATNHRRFRWVYVNSVANKLYHYRIQFHKKSDSTQFICDPAISNLGDQ